MLPPPLHPRNGSAPHRDATMTFRRGRVPSRPCLRRGRRGSATGGPVAAGRPGRRGYSREAATVAIFIVMPMWVTPKKHQLGNILSRTAVHRIAVAVPGRPIRNRKNLHHILRGAIRLRSLRELTGGRGTITRWRGWYDERCDRSSEKHVGGLLPKYLVHERDRNRPFANGGCDSLDVAAAHVSNGKDTWPARFEQVRPSCQRPVRLVELLR